MIENEQQQEYYSPKDARKILGVGRNRMYDLLNRDDFPKLRYAPGGKYYIPREAFEKWRKRQYERR